MDTNVENTHSDGKDAMEAYAEGIAAWYDATHGNPDGTFMETIRLNKIRKESEYAR